MNPKPIPRANAGILKNPWGRVLLTLCIVQFVLLLSLSRLWNGKEEPLPTRPRGGVYSATNREPFFLGTPGPWGELEYARINIEPPDEFVPIDGRSFPKTLWFFADHTPEQFQALVTATDLTAPQRAELLNRGAWVVETNGLTVAPSDQLILELSPTARARLYAVLAKSARNDFQCWPYTYRSSGFDDWFSKSGLADTTLAWLKRLVYQRGTTLCFSDLPQLFSKVPTVAEQRRLVKTLSRNSALLMKVRISPDSDVAGLTAYWTKGRRAKDIQPLLESLTKLQGSIGLDVAHLLPQFARKRLNTYPPPENPTGQPPPDCFWTTFNFFNDPPDDRYFNDAIWRKELAESYTIVTNPICGDLVFFLRPDDTPIHAAVYVADDVVFTKNGGNYRQPWLLMKLEDVRARYPEDFVIKVILFRANKLPE